MHVNDAAGQFPPSLYAAQASPPALRPPLSGVQKADVAVVGGGYTGLSAALHLAEAGRKVVLIEAHRAGWGASGRNGGQLGTGHRVEQEDLEARHGLDTARQLWAVAVEAVARVKDRVACHKIDCALMPGVAHVNHRARYDADSERFAAHMARHYDYDVEYLPPTRCAELVRAPGYSGGTLDGQAAHLDPLALALGLARAAEEAGVQICERSEARLIEQGRVVTEGGEVQAAHIVLACNGYRDRLRPEPRVMPINNFVVATEPLAPGQVLGAPIAVADSRFVVNYFRMSRDNRLVFGGGETYGYRFPKDIRGFVRPRLEQVFPQLKGVPLTHGWGGTLAITRSRMPCLARDGTIWSASGYSGHGVGMAHMSGALIAEAICGVQERFGLMARLPLAPFPGGPGLRQPMLVAAMLWYALLDRI